MSTEDAVEEFSKQFSQDSVPLTNLVRDALARIMGVQFVPKGGGLRWCSSGVAVGKIDVRELCSSYSMSCAQASTASISHGAVGVWLTRPSTTQSVLGW